MRYDVFGLVMVLEPMTCAPFMDLILDRLWLVTPYNVVALGSQQGRLGTLRAVVHAVILRGYDGEILRIGGTFKNPTIGIAAIDGTVRSTVGRLGAMPSRGLNMHKMRAITLGIG